MLVVCLLCIPGLATVTVLVATLDFLCSANRLGLTLFVSAFAFLFAANLFYLTAFALRETKAVTPCLLIQIYIKNQRIMLNAVLKALSNHKREC